MQLTHISFTFFVKFRVLHTCMWLVSKIRTFPVRSNSIQHMRCDYWLWQDAPLLFPLLDQQAQVFIHEACASNAPVSFEDILMRIAKPWKFWISVLERRWLWSGLKGTRPPTSISVRFSGRALPLPRHWSRIHPLRGKPTCRGGKWKMIPVGSNWVRWT